MQILEPSGYDSRIRGKCCHLKATVRFKVPSWGGLMSKENLRDNPTAIAKYLTEIFDKNDFGGILDAIKFALQEQNVKALAESTGMRRDGLYKTFDGRKDPQLDRKST